MPRPARPPPRLTALLTLLTLPLFARAAALRVNAGGKYLPSIAFRADLTAYLANPSTAAVTAASPALSALPGSWGPVYQTYRYAHAGDLEYRLPVPAGAYALALLFLESYAGTASPGARVFAVKINGKTVKSALDVYKSAGFEKPLYLKFNNVKDDSGFITVTLARIPGKENPMLSGLVLTGPDPAGKVGNAGLGGNAPPNPQNAKEPKNTDAPATVKAPASGGDPGCAKGVFGKNNFTGQMACCVSKCGKCGGAGCGAFAQGELCCISSVVFKGLSCDTHGPPCVPSADPPANPKPTAAPPTSGLSCQKGILGVNKNSGKAACCEAACGKCGGKGCGSFAKGKLCCISSVNKLGKSCSSSGPPCVPGGGGSVTAPTAKPTKEPTTGEPPSLPPPSTGGGCPVTGATANAFRMNLAGGAIAGAEMGADNSAYITSSSKGQVFSAPAMSVSAAGGPKPWDAAYSSHRWTPSSDLTYKIPVPSGKYTVKLLFAETFFTQVGLRTFDVLINGVEEKKDLDVFKEVGKNVGLLLSVSNISPTQGGITVSLVKSAENPMISGIMIEGAGAGAQAVGGGCASTGDKGGTGGDEDDNGGDKGDTGGDKGNNGGFNHRAHSVPGGPYIATDFDKNGKAFVSLDGTQSHSHYQDPGPPVVTGKIVSFKWTWKEEVNGKMVTKTNTDKSGKFTAAFPIGKTTVTLQVVDSTGDVATDSAVVEVKGSTANGAYCYYYDYGNSVFATVPLKLSLDSTPRPLYGAPSGMINFKSGADFGAIPFANNAFAVRCAFFIDVPKTADYSYSVQHQGPFKLYNAGVLMSQSNSQGTTKSSSKNLKAGLNPFQLLYFRPKNLAPKLILSDGSAPMSSILLQHDSSATLPVIQKLSKTSSTPAGGQNIQIFGSGFINGVSVKFGGVEASNLMSSNAGVVQVTVPPGVGVVPVTVHTNAGVSNEIAFTYTSGETLDQPVVFQQTKLKDASGNPLTINLIASCTYGPDRRLYLGSTSGKVYALSVNKEYKVQTTCEKQVAFKRHILGLAFSPFTNNLKMYFTSSTMYWGSKLPFEQGWPNGKIETIQFSPTQLTGPACAFDQQDLVTGLPVSNHDHGVNKLQFLPGGELLVGVGGFTNGGISVPGKKPVPGGPKEDLLGGVSSNPLSAAIVSCPANQKTNIVYDNYVDPQKAKIISGGACKVYASGFRNTFGMTLHTNGNLYALDNGPNFGFGDFSTNCVGGKKPGQNLKDKLFLVQKGKFHGHPNLNRGQCEHYPPSAVQPIIPNVQSSSDGIIEYRSNTFGGEIKGNLYISKFSFQTPGLVSQVKLGPNAGKTDPSYAPNFLPYSGLSLVEGPRGELIMPRVFQHHVVIAVPSYKAPGVTFMIGVHPKQGPSSGGTKVLISGHNFGSTPTATFGGTKCTKVVVVDNDSFTCITPPKSKNQQVAVVVTGVSGKSPTYGSDFWYM